MFSFLFLLSNAALIPTPKRPTGITWNPEAKDIVIEMYGDPLCPDCLEVWNTVKQVVAEYKDHAQFRLHLLPLPYHTWAFVLTKFIAGVKTISEAKARDFMDLLYTGDQDLFGNDKMSTYTQPQVIDYMKQYTAKKLDLTETQVMNAFNSAELAARIEFKYSAAHNVAGTPTFFINGAEVIIEENTIEYWRKVLDKLL